MKRGTQQPPRGAATTRFGGDHMTDYGGLE